MKIQILMNFYHICLVHAKFYTNFRNIIFEYDINLNNKCQSPDGMFDALFGPSIAECIGECGIQTQCVGVNYIRRIHKCELFNTLKEGENNVGSCIYVLASDINIFPNPCGRCDVGKTCDKTRHRCQYTECGTLSVIPFGTLSTDESTHGTTVVYRCHYGYERREGDLERTCVQGFWNGTKPTCSTITNIGCYVESYLYKGISNTTISGKQCQRWDLQTPHEHGQTYSSNFPDVTLAATENFCRDPDNTGSPWCYTTNSTIRWEVCGVAKCLV